MRILKLIAALGAALGFSALVLAQQPSRHFSGPELWTDPAPAIYRIKAAGTDLCVERAPGSTSTQLPHMVLRPCASPIGAQSIALTPYSWQALAPGSGSAPFNPDSLSFYVTWRMTTPFFGNCLTAARGVVFGPPAVDEVPCNRRVAGVPVTENDQLWEFHRRGPVHTFEVRSFLNGRCWSAQGGQLRSGVQLVLERCDERTAGQQFVIDPPHADLVEDYNRNAALEFGWLPIPGMGSAPPARFRSMPGTNLPSGDYTQGIETANDNGQECARICAEDDRCLAFTWVHPAMRSGRPMCYKKDTINAPILDSFTHSGIVRPR